MLRLRPLLPNSCGCILVSGLCSASQPRNVALDQVFASSTIQNFYLNPKRESSRLASASRPSKNPHAVLRVECIVKPLLLLQGSPSYVHGSTIRSSSDDDTVLSPSRFRGVRMASMPSFRRLQPFDRRGISA
jgi:hypothetical protein